MLQADCAPITGWRFNAPAISSELVSESIAVPEATVSEDPAVIAWRAWREAEFAYEPAKDTGINYERTCMAEIALCDAVPTTMAGAVAQLRCALTFMEDFRAWGWVHNLALDRVNPDDAVARAGDSHSMRMLAGIIDFLEARA